MNQQTAFGILKSGRNVFLTGSAGTGKTHLLNMYIDYLKERGIKPSIVAPTGIAASHIGGMTIHSFFGIGIRDYYDEYMIDSLLQKEFLYKRLSKVKVLIVDEVSMVSPDIFSTMDRALRGFKQVDKPFGGVQLIVSGDFFQLPPVSKTKREIKFAWQTESWKQADFRSCYLKEKFRQSDEVLINILDEIRSGQVSAKSMKVFKECRGKELPTDFEITKLYTHNIDVDRINEEELNKISSPTRIFTSDNTGTKKNVEKIFKSSLVREELKIKLGAVVIFIKNNYEKGYVNGTLGKIIDFNSITGAPVVQIFSGQTISAEKESWEFENTSGTIVAQIRQIPLRLAWALTVHKSQGMTLDAAEIDLSKTFETGQGYVALSRIKSISGLRLMGLNEIALQVDGLVSTVDKHIKKSSDLNVLKFNSFSDSEKTKMFDEFVLKNNGTLKKDDIKRNAVKLKKKKKVKKKVGTLGETKELLEKKKTIEDIVKERGCSRDTILKHIQKIILSSPDLDIEYLKPKTEILKKVKKAVKDIKIKNRKIDLLESGDIKLRSIFKYLKEKVSYEDIKVSLLFVNKK